MTPARGEQAPQTVESLQEIMAKDAVLLEDAHKEIARLKRKINQLQQKLASRKRSRDL